MRSWRIGGQEEDQVGLPLRRFGIAQFFEELRVELAHQPHREPRFDAQLIGARRRVKDLLRPLLRRRAQFQHRRTAREVQRQHARLGG